jgi:large subunit ribosomal protein L10
MSEAEAGTETETRRTETIPQWKQEEVDQIVDLIRSYDSVGVVGIAGIPSRQLQDMRRDLHGTAALRVSRNSLVRRALEEVDEGVEQLVEEVAGEVGLVVTDENPFSLYQQLEASKTAAPINAGEVAPNDIVIPEGDTGIDPGPFVGELQNVGADARIQEGSIQVLSDSTVLAAGEEVSPDLANVLNELGIEPKEVGLDLRAVYADGVLFEPEELAIDVDEYRADVAAAATGARNLSVNAAYPTARTAGTLLGKGAGEAKALGVYAAVESPDLADDLVAKADAQVRALAARIDDEEALPEEFRGATDAEQASDDAEPESESDEAGDAEESESESESESPDESDEDDGDAGDALGEMF